ncbi:MAG: ATP-binding protein [Bdellovibrionota bacterium]
MHLKKLNNVSVDTAGKVLTMTFHHSPGTGLLHELSLSKIPGITISTNCSEGYGLFSDIQQIELGRVLSNLIDNSVEATNDDCKVEVILKKKDKKILFSVIDNSMGIPAEILPKLGQRGISYGKPAGAGLGLYHACNSIRKCGGELTIDSSENKGATVNILLNCAEVPDWFIKALTIPQKGNIIVIDDDNSVYGLWKRRFDPLVAKNPAIALVCFDSLSKAKDWYLQTLLADDGKNLYLCDYRFCGEEQTGLDFIEMLGISEQAVLVSNYVADSSIKHRCGKLGVRSLSKMCITIVPIIQT